MFDENIDLCKLNMVTLCISTSKDHLAHLFKKNQSVENTIYGFKGSVAG